MSNRFTERAQRVILIAQEEAKRWQNASVEPLHILAGLFSLGEGTAIQLLAKCGLSHATVKARSLSLSPPSSETLPLGGIPFTSSSRKVLEFSVIEAQQLGHAFVGTEHILLGLLNVEFSSSLLKERGLSLDKAREEILSLVGKGHLPPTKTPGPFSSKYWGQQLMMVSIEPDVRGVLITSKSRESNEPAIIILLEEGADLDKIFKSLETVLPNVRHLCFKKPHQRPVTWTEGQWKELSEAATTLEF